MVDASKTARRKADHIRICSSRDVQTRRATTGLEDVHLIHNALPTTSFTEVDVSTELFSHKLSAPIIIAGMTGGTRKAARINASLAEAAERLGLGMGVGSQRIALEDTEQAFSFKVAREKAPHALLIANIGCAQLVGEHGVEGAIRAVEMMDADALAVHFNSLHEAVQVEGQTDFRRALEKLKELSRSLGKPIIAKETGAGISAEVARKLEASGVHGIDVGGLGGTSWAAVEYYRAKEARNSLNQQIGLTFWDWGIPTVISIVEVVKSTKLTTIATGGIRSGLDVVKTLALGAHAAGVAAPLLNTATAGPEKVIRQLNCLVSELKVAVFLAGGRSASDLRTLPIVITGKTFEWLHARGFKTEEYAQRNPETGG